MSDPSQSTASARPRRPRARSVMMPNGWLFRPRVGRDWIGKTLYRSAAQALAVARAHRDRLHPKSTP